MDIEQLLPLLKAHGVIHYKDSSREITLGIQPIAQDPSRPDPLIEALKKHEESLPVDLRADDLMNQDKIMNWSSPDHQEALPLTEELEL